MLRLWRHSKHTKEGGENGGSNEVNESLAKAVYKNKKPFTANIDTLTHTHTHTIYA